MLILGLVFGCTDGSPSQEDDSVPVDDSTRVDDTGAPVFEVMVTPFPLMVNEVTVDITLGEAHAVKVACEAPTDDPWPERLVFRSDAAATQHSVFLQALLPDTAYTCTVEDGGAVLGTFDVTTEPLPPEIDFTDVTVEFDDPTAFVPGWTLYNPTDWSSSAPDLGADLVVDPMGRVRWYQNIAGYDADGVFEYDIPTKQFYAGGGFFSIQPLTAWDLAGNELIRWDDVGADHDIEKIGTDYYLVTPGDDGPTGNHCLSQRDKDKNLVWEWCTDDSDIVPDNVANSMAFESNEAGEFIYVTMQIKGIVYKLDKNTKEVVWMYYDGGDFTGDVPYSAWMHDIHVIPCAGYDECLLFYANGDDLDPTTWIRQIGIDENAMTAEVVREWTEDGWYEPKLGGIDPFSDHWLVAQGHFVPDPLSDRNSQLAEVNPAGDVVWRLTVGSPTISVYRARRVSACDLFGHAGYCPSLDD